MKQEELKIKLHYSEMEIPKRAHKTDSGVDLYLMKVIPKKKDVYFFDTGVSIEPPNGYYIELFPRSSIYKHDFIMANSVGIIDESYRGILYMPMRYVGEGDGLTEAENLIGHRVGQIIIKKLYNFDLKIVEQVSETKRGDGGFGSTGQK